jgi:hypothetical protein
MPYVGGPDRFTVAGGGGATWDDIKGYFDFSYMANNVTGSPPTTWSNEGTNAEGNSDLVQVTNTPIISSDHFGTGYDGIEMQAGDAIKNDTTLTTSLDTTTNGLTMFWLGEFDAFSGTGIFARVDGVGGGNANRHQLQCTSGGVLQCRAGSAGPKSGSTLSTATTYLIVVYFDHTNDSDSWVELDGAVDISVGRKVVSDADTPTHCPAIAGSTLDFTIHAHGGMEGEISAGELEDLEEYASAVGASI